MPKVDFWSDMSDAMSELVDALIEVGITPKQVRKLTSILRESGPAKQKAKSL